jgi:hypothetical protein
MTVIRYKWNGSATVQDIQANIPAGFTPAIVNTGEMFVDIDITPNPTAAAHLDLDEYMATLGWTFVIDDPTTALPQPAAQLMFGAEAVATNTTARYLYPGYINSIGQTSPIQVPVSRGGTLRDMRIHQTGDGNGTDMTYTVRVNGVATAIAVTMASTDDVGFNVVDSVAVDAGDLVDIEVTKAGGLGNSPGEIICTVGLV